MYYYRYVSQDAKQYNSGYLDARLQSQPPEVVGIKGVSHCMPTSPHNLMERS